ncbi:prolyl 4-hydroxylase subunit alpha-2 [Nilaparvata lugens]|uniref:prolyl 4-hydroxylase subunit alpha-2 n=1 Tax=Nilaparvata lugens TaxID=108931 RepID=UPI00193E370E|nr:prolyl 4-hydroxylase subunit alpha-2 [Nilaparvata lugens]
MCDIFRKTSGDWFFFCAHNNFFIAMELRFGCWGAIHVTAFVLVIAIGIANTNAALYEAIVNLEKLLGTEAALIRVLDEYISFTEQRLAILKRHAAKYSAEHHEAINDVSAYLSNPINAFRIIKRLTYEWNHTQSLMFDFTQEVRQYTTQYRQVLKFPTEEDLSGAATALMRLQDTYQLDTASVARGQLNGVQYTTQLSGDDCFELGRHSYWDGNFLFAAMWMSESLNRQQWERNQASFERWQKTLEYIDYSVKMKDYEMVTIVPTLYQPNDPSNFTFFKAALENKHKAGIFHHLLIIGGRKPGDYEMVTIVPTLYQPNDPSNFTFFKAALENKHKVAEQWEPIQAVYKKLCRNDLSLTHQELAQLKCRYVHRNVPFLRIGPLKEEEAYLEPRIVLYRDVIYDSEIELLKKMALPKLKVMNLNKASNTVALYRISAGAWLYDDDHPSIERLSKRVEYMTSLDMSYAESLHVTNYGIGGYYEAHHDYLSEELFKNYGRRKQLGNRIATLMFYLSDVIQGGATVFPLLNVTIWPEKGSAVFWYNLLHSGERDTATFHAACPVLVGSKWVSTKWVHEAGQEFRRPCLLEK